MVQKTCNFKINSTVYTTMGVHKHTCWVYNSAVQGVMSSGDSEPRRSLYTLCFAAPNGYSNPPTLYYVSIVNKDHAVI